MNALVKKEIRLLLPSFLISLALAFSILLMPKDVPGNRWEFLYVLPMICCPAMVVMMSLGSFGRELSVGTLATLLVQPTPRNRIWRVKSGLLFVALAIVFAAWWISCLLGGPSKLSPQETRDLLLATVIFLFTAYSGGLWTVLLLRQVAVAFWFTLLVPAAMLLTFVNLLAENHPEQLTSVIVTALIIYSITGFLFARRLFLRAQDTQWTGGAISLPRWRILPSLLTGTGTKRGWRPLAAMLAREFQLHQSQLIIVGGLALLHVGVLAARAIGNGFKEYSSVRFALDQFWCFWFVIPVLVGCAAVAEERRLGTLEGELCLPARRRTQFIIKLGVVLLFSALLGAVMPLLLEGSRILPNTQFGGNLRPLPEFFTGFIGRAFMIIFHWLVLTSYWLGVLAFVSIYAGIGAIAFYFSTLSRNTLQAIGPAILGIFASVFLWVAAFTPERFIGFVPWRGLLVYLIGVPTFSLTLVCLAYWNYKRLLVGWPAWRRNLLTLLAAFTFVIASTTTLYYRAWELVMSIEPEQHGPARLTSPESVTLQSDYFSLTIGLPDGNYWSENFGFSVTSLTDLLTSEWRLMPGSGRFVKGTNWVEVADCYFDTVGIQKDGSLWISTNPVPRGMYANPRNVQNSPVGSSPFVRVGDGHGWKSVVVYGRNALLLKVDGTLWTWRTEQINWTNGWPGLITLPLEQVGTNSDWAKIQRIFRWLCLSKKDGRVWSNIAGIIRNDSDTIKLNGYHFTRTEFLDHSEWRGAGWAQAIEEVVGGFLVGVRDDGTFRLMAQRRPMEKNVQWGMAAQDIQLGRDTNWVAVAGNSDATVTLKADGSLWLWTFADDPRTNPESATATRLGTNSDWVAISLTSGGIIALSGDGGLWYWRFNPRHYDSREFPLSPLIGVSRKPQRITGIFDRAE